MASVLNAVVLVVILSPCGTKNSKPVESPKVATNLRDVVFVVRSQPNSFHAKQAERFAAHVFAQLAETEKEERPEVVVMGEQWYEWHLGYWAILPNLHRLEEAFRDRSWVFLCEEDTRVDVFKLLELLQKHDASKPKFLGRGLYDEPNPDYTMDSSIFASPDFGAGTLFSMPLISRLVRMVKYWKSDGVVLKNVQFEIAKLIWNGGKGLALTHVPQLCTVPQEGCISHLADKFVDCGPPIPKEDLFVAVRTSSKFHKTRVPFIKKTWGSETPHIEFFSDVVDLSVPTTDLGIPKEKMGRCELTMTILHMATKRGHRRRSWLLIAQDDTIIYLPRLRQLLACYNPSDVVHMGDRHGYKVYDPLGFGFIAAGGGMVFSRTAVHLLRDVECGSTQDPDDMPIGKFLERRMRAHIHSPYFHQGRLEDYSPDFLAGRLHISFRKHPNMDPLHTYAFLTGQKNTSHTTKTEL